MRFTFFQKSLIILFCSVLFFNSCKSKQYKEETATTTFYLIRHAEKDRSDASNKNPELTSIGLNRAGLWASYFDSIPLDKIYSTDYSRTLQTVENLSEKIQIPIKLYDPNNLINDSFMETSKGLSILICGHSNTTPILVNQLIGKESYTQMDDSDNSSLYIVRMEGETISVEIRNVSLPVN